MDARTKVEKARFLFRLGAPFALVSIVLLRIFLETSILAVSPAFSYYRTIHHFYWFVNPFLLGYVFGCLIGRLHPAKLMWGGYGIAVIFSPVIWSIITGDRLELTYQSGPPQKMMRDILAFGLTVSQNHPLIPGAAVGLLGMFFGAYFYTRQWKRAFAVGLISFAIMAVFSVVWIGSPGMNGALLHVNSRLTNHPFLAAWHVLLHFFIFPPLLILAGFFEKDCRLWLISGIVGLGAWILFVTLALSMGWFGDSVFDSVVTGLPIGTCIFLLVRILFWISGREGHPLALVGFAWVLVGQILVMGPIYIGKEAMLTREVIRVWTADPFGEIRLVERENFPRLLEPLPGAVSMDRLTPHLQFQAAPWLLTPAPGGNGS
jgi:hypothetical protein